MDERFCEKEEIKTEKTTANENGEQNIPVILPSQPVLSSELPYAKIRRAGLIAGLALVSMFASQIFFSIIYIFIEAIFGTLDTATGVKMISDTSSLYFFLYVLQYIVMFAPPLLIIGLAGKTKGVFSLYEKAPARPENTCDGEENEKYEKKIAAHKKLKSGILPEALLLLPIAVGGSYVMSVVATYVEGVFNSFGFVSPEIFSNNPVDVLGWVFYFTVTCVLAPVFEEMLFRGGVLKMLLPYGKGFAITCQAILFAIFHGTVAQLPYTLVGGLIMGYLAVRHGGILPSILLHLFNNLFSMLLTLLIPQSVWGNPTVSILCNLAIYIVMIVGGIVAVKVLAKRDKTYFRTNSDADETPVADRLYGFSAFNAFLTQPVLLVYMIANIGMMLLTMLVTGIAQ